MSARGKEGGRREGGGREEGECVWRGGGIEKVTYGGACSLLSGKTAANQVTSQPLTREHRTQPPKRVHF